MSAKPAIEDSQSWKLLLAPRNGLDTLLQISQTGLFIKNYNNNMLSISNLNPLQAIKYDVTLDPKYHHTDITDDAFENRHPTFIKRPQYFQKWQTTDTIKLQHITAGLGQLILKMYNADGTLVDSFDFEFVSIPTVLSPYQVQQLSIPLTGIDDGFYCFVLEVTGAETPLAIYECVQIADDFPETVLIEYSSSYNLLNGYFDSWKPMIRVESWMGIWKPDSNFTDYEDELKDIELLHAVPSAIRTLIVGKPQGIPDWMALKINEILLLNRCYIENTRYTRTADSKFEEVFTQGYTMPYYKTTIAKAINDSSLTIDDANIPQLPVAMIASLDGNAFGKANQVINITIEKE
jgi:hypothetical protein